MPPKSNIHYSAPAVPSFLRSLHAQVNGGRSGPSQAARRDEDEDELTAVLREASASGSHTAGAAAEQEEEEEDEWSGAQVVVLKEGRHLTEADLEELKQGKKDEEHSQTTSEKGNAKGKERSTMPSNPSAPATKRKREAVRGAKEEESTLLSSSLEEEGKGKKSKKPNDLAAAKELIAVEKRRKLEEKRKAEEKAERKKRGKKGGGGLSFQFED